MMGRAFSMKPQTQAEPAPQNIPGTPYWNKITTFENTHQHVRTNVRTYIPYGSDTTNHTTRITPVLVASINTRE